MKKTALLLLLLALPVFLFIRAKRVLVATPKTYAVVVGISSFQNPGITELRYAHRDAEAFRSFLESPIGGAIPPENIALLTNERATRAAIIKNMRALFDQATANDVVIFYISTHGIPDAKIKTDLYFTTYDTDPTNYTGTALYRDDVLKFVSNSSAKIKVIYSDACHSGGSGIYRGVKDDASDLVNRMQVSLTDVKEPCFAIFAASSSAEQSAEDARWGGGHGIFTYELIRGLQGAADKTAKQNAGAKGNGDGLVTGRELADYLHDMVPAATHNGQTPEASGNNIEAIPLAALTAQKFATAVNNLKKAEKPKEDAADATYGKIVPKDEPKQFDTGTTDMKNSICVDDHYAYGEFCFINDYGEDLLLQIIDGGKTYNPQYNLLIPVGQKSCAQRINASYVNNRTIENLSSNIKFTFITTAEGKPVRRGTLQQVIETCKSKTVVLSKKTLYMSAQ